MALELANGGTLPGAKVGRGWVFMMEAGVGIEPAYTALQAAA